MEPVRCLFHTPAQIMHPVFTEDASALRGWWCPECNHWVAAVGREREFKPEDWHDLKERLNNETTK